MITKELLKLPVADLVPYENNPRVISPEAVNACAESMRQCSALDPIEVDENNVILSGHTRRLALMQLHVEMADVVRYTGLTEEQKQKYRMHNNFAVYGYTLGCALANLTSPLGVLDVIVGSLANLIVGTFARRSGKVVPTILFGTVFNGIVVGAELSIVYGSPFLLNAVCVAAGEGISLLLGAVLYKLVGKRIESIWR